MLLLFRSWKDRSVVSYLLIVNPVAFGNMWKYRSKFSFMHLQPTVYHFVDWNSDSFLVEKRAYNSKKHLKGTKPRRRDRKQDAGGEGRRGGWETLGDQIDRKSHRGWSLGELGWTLGFRSAGSLWTGFTCQSEVPQGKSRKGNESEWGHGQGRYVGDLFPRWLRVWKVAAVPCCL